MEQQSKCVTVGLHQWNPFHSLISCPAPLPPQRRDKWTMNYKSLGLAQLLKLSTDLFNHWMTEPTKHEPAARRYVQMQITSVFIRWVKALFISWDSNNERGRGVRDTVDRIVRNKVGGTERRGRIRFLWKKRWRCSLFVVDIRPFYCVFCDNSCFEVKAS